MKVVIIVLVLIVIGFAVAIGVAVYRATTPPAPPSAHGPPTDSNGNIDEDALADWKPPSMAALMGSVSRPFAPKVFKQDVRVDLPAAAETGDDRSETKTVPSAKKDMRIARIRLLSGRGAVATYEVFGAPGKGETSPQAVCLCSQGTLLDEDEAEDCGDPWRNARASGDGKFLCRKKDDDVSAVVYRSGGTIKVTSMDDQAVSVSIR